MKELERFQALLKGPKGASAKQLAVRSKCSLPTVYRRIRALEALGAVVAVSREARSETGPTPRKFILVKGASFSGQGKAG